MCLRKRRVSWVWVSTHATFICHQLKYCWAYILKSLEILKHTCKLVPDNMLIYFWYIYYQVLKIWFSFSFFNIFSEPFLCLLSHPVLWEMLALGAYQNKLVLLLHILNINRPLSWFTSNSSSHPNMSPERPAEGINENFFLLSQLLLLLYTSTVKFEAVTSDKVALVICCTFLLLS